MTEQDFLSHLHIFFDKKDVEFDVVKRYLQTGKSNFCFLLGLTLEKSYQDDDQSKICGLCQTKFTATNRRHHCRMCQQLFCGQCSRTVMTSPGNQQRICLVCSAVKQSSELHGSVQNFFGIKQIEIFIQNLKERNIIIVANFARVLGNYVIVDNERKIFSTNSSQIITILLNIYEEQLNTHIDDVEFSHMISFVQFICNLIQSYDTRYIQLLKKANFNISTIEKAFKQYYDKKESHEYELQLLRLLTHMSLDQEYAQQIGESKTILNLIYEKFGTSEHASYKIYFYNMLSNLVLSQQIPGKQITNIIVKYKILPIIYQWTFTPDNIISNVIGLRFFHSLMYNVHTRKYILKSGSLNLFSSLAKYVPKTENQFLTSMLFETIKILIETSMKNENIFNPELFMIFFNTDIEYQQNDDYKTKLKYLMYLCKKNSKVFNDQMEMNKILVNFLKEMYSYQDLNRALKYLADQSANKYFKKYGMLHLADDNDLMKLDQYDLAQDCFYNKKQRHCKDNHELKLECQNVPIDKGFNIFKSQVRSKK